MTSADSLIHQAIEYQNRGDEEAARLYYLAALTIEPVNAAALMNLSTILSNRNQLPSALTMIAKVVDRNRNSGIAWSSYANILARLERFDESLEAIQTAMSLQPDNTGIWHNATLLCHRMGLARGELKFHEDALSHIDRVIALGKDTPEVRNDRAHVLLALGRLREAWAEYENRWHIMPHLEPWDFYIPEWKGEHLFAKRILVHHEQGFGDTIMCSRFIKELTDEGAYVSFAVPTALVRFFEHQDWPVEIINMHQLTEADGKRFDYHAPLYAVMRHLNIDSPANINSRPYLKAPALTSMPVFGGEAFNVGICWSSGKRGNNMDWRRRVSPLALWLSLAEVPRVHLWSLCVGGDAREEISSLGAEGAVNDRTSSFEDFAAAAAFIDQLDLVITVDTAAAHLAASMGKRTWMLSQYTPCWRWWQIAEESGLPWYETMLILRQMESDGWVGQLRRCKHLLESMPQLQPKMLEAAQ